ncbi:hypothetical protein BKA83DRAFT_4128305 [Pisolithus microcarpus]|nr:hypothetical protein BKA83DRAFT_4128305 [Pisolithus microcarpus]
MGGKDYNTPPYHQAQNDGPGLFNLHHFSSNLVNDNRNHKGYNGDDGLANFCRMGSKEYNTPCHHQAQNDRPQFDNNKVIQHTTSHHSSSDNSSLFLSVLNHIRGHQPEQTQEAHGQREHSQGPGAAYNKGSTSGLSAGSLGSTAALQVGQVQWLPTD